ncbi:hypothetical protein BDN71DRAFT_902965 [Pleurotus eryngii]|uniref:Uncharacterized protein n=1 Tax=Pleurotus eryngii TaxID=5323 RepID=A0A9P5ZXV8_PLEER|nr:hypothetical protein BDN71DRAFT_902965 [Pleurotus eryngii]
MRRSCLHYSRRSFQPLHYASEFSVIFDQRQHRYPQLPSGYTPSRGSLGIYASRSATHSPTTRLRQSKLGSRCGRIDSCDRAIRTLDDIASLTPPGDSEHARIVCQLGYAYQTRYEREHDVADADSAIMYLLKGLSGSLSHLHPPRVAFDASKGLFQQFGREGKPDDLHQVIQNFASLVGEPGVEGCDVYESFGGAPACRHILFGNDIDIDTDIELPRLVVDMLPAGYPVTLHCISNLGIFLQQRFGVSKNVVDLDEAILYHQQALKYSPPQFTSMIRNRLGCALFDRFDFLDNPTDSSDAISNLSQAARMIPSGPPEAGIIRANLATALLQLPQSEGSHPGFKATRQRGSTYFGIWSQRRPLSSLFASRPPCDERDLNTNGAASLRPCTPTKELHSFYRCWDGTAWQGDLGWSQEPTSSG